jgi:hypothetical protein
MVKIEEMPPSTSSYQAVPVMSPVNAHQPLTSDECFYQVCLLVVAWVCVGVRARDSVPCVMCTLITKTQVEKSQAPSSPPPPPACKP